MDDPYVLENGTLINKLGITEYEELKKAECDIGFVKLMSIDDVDVNCDSTTLISRIHSHIFKDVFEWAGEYRTVPVYKPELVIPGISLEYERPRDIAKNLKRKTDEMDHDKWNPNDLEAFAKDMTKHLARIWRVHPFRDGNTRTTLGFAYLFAKKHGINLDMGKALNNLSRKIAEDGKVKRYSIRDKFVLAALDDKDYPEPEALQELLLSVLSKDKAEKEPEL